MGSTGRLTLVLSVSGLAHAGVLALLATLHPQLRQAPAPPVFEVEVTPFYTARPRREQRGPSHPDRRKRTAHPAIALQNRSPSESATAATVEGPRAAAGVDEGLRRTLRRGIVGCANPDGMRLDVEERNDCLEKFGQDAKVEPHIAAGMAPSKRAAFDDKSAARERMRLYRKGIVPPGGEAHVHPQLGYVPSLTEDIIRASR